MKTHTPETAKPLNDRQERFVHEYLVDQNASAAAGRAGYSTRTKGTHAAQMMKNPAIRQAISVGLSDLFARIDLNALEVLRRQVQQAYLDPAKLFDAGQRAIPLAQLDADTRGGLTVAYALRDDGRQVMTVRQTPRHVALAVLQKRLENFEKLQAEAFAEPQEKASPAAASAGSACGIFNVDLKLDAAALLPPAALDMAAADAALAHAALALGGEVSQAAASGPPATLPRPAMEAQQVAADGRAPSLVNAPPVADAGEDPPPPSPFEPGYDFKKDPDAMYGGRFTAWNRYWKEKREREQAAAEEAAARRNPPPNMRIAPGKTVPVRMEPGYNPPWLRSNRPEFAIGAGECWID
ncbi:MAG TPA: terminase small subunit [Burkholderiales bacterium]